MFSYFDECQTKKAFKYVAAFSLIFQVVWIP